MLSSSGRTVCGSQDAREFPYISHDSQGAGGSLPVQRAGAGHKERELMQHVSPYEHQPVPVP